MTRVAVADLGTNSTRLLIADVDASGSIEEVERLLTITRLGEGVDERRVLGEAPRRRVLDTLERYAARADEHGAGRRLAVATSAVRDAANRDAFLAEVAATGFRPQLLSGSEEALATFRGVLSSRPHTREGTVVIDVGGGSTEVALGGPAGVTWERSFDVGCVRMTERFLGEDRIAPDARAACRAALDEAFAAIPEDVVEATRDAVGVAGTVTTLAALDLGLPGYDAERIHGQRLSRAAVAAWEERLCSLDLAGRRALPAMEDGRAPVICGGVIVLGAAMDRLGLDGIDVSERDILHGAALLAAGPVEAPEAGALRSTGRWALLLAVLFALVAGGARLIVDLPVWIYPFAAALGAVIGASLGPLLSLARADGSDTGAVESWTPGLTGADAPTGGGEAADRAPR